MGLAPQTKLGPYEIVSLLGAGGMGEVYRARDARLDRDVAIKVLPEALASDKERVLRFEREAKALATLSHPNIAAIYGFEEQDGKRLLVMELAEGETLSERLARGPIPIDESLDVCRKIAEGLEAAHEKGIVHRDLKPANIKIGPDGSVKVLDFGLAKALLGDTASSASSPTEVVHSPTITAEYTRPGVILGTAGYMSPEQARGRSVDKRTDIWAFGCVLFECLSGAKLFSGETATDSIGAILHKEPEWALLPPNTPPTVQLLLRRCLAKDRNKRLRDIGDARIEIENAISDPSSTMLRLGDAAIFAIGARGGRAAWRRAIPWAICSILLAALGTLWYTNRPAKQQLMRLTMTIPESEALSAFAGTMMDISPDGSRIVFVGRNESGRQLYIRHLQQPVAIPLANTDDAFCPFFSPDGEWIAFGQKGKLRKISVLGGPSMTICDAQDIRGGSWGVDGTILFAPNPRSGIYRVSAAGGEPVKLTDAGAGEATPSNRWPSFLPDGKTFLYTATTRNSDYSDAKIVARSLDSSKEKVVYQGGTFGRYLPTGHIVFGRSGTLMAVPFDAKKLEVAGAPIPVLEGILSAPTYGGVQCVFSQTGTLVYVSGSASGDEKLPIWIDREGKETPISQLKRDFLDLRLSPDGKRMSAAIMENGNLDIWILEIERDMLTRLTYDEGVDQNPRWSPDGKWILFSSNRGKSNFNLFRQLADGTGEAERLTTSDSAQNPSSFTPDGSIAVFTEFNPKTEVDLMILRLDNAERKPETFLATPFNERQPALSPDGKWIAYVSNESGEPEIYVRPFLRPGAKVKVSSALALVPRWSPDGNEIIYRVDQKIMAVSLSVQGDEIHASNPHMLFELKGNAYMGPFDVAADGRFLFYRPAGEITNQSQQPTVVVNWFEELKAKSSLQK
ncbi:MAG: PD40 domain-containing protein [Planctomycetes bacterium]|nr:PD40 domain-containing protein [Planctomycetota bacterium]MBI3835076.1 PD40 domain-containing protein [Planctomycetota bacterium]